MTSHAGLMRPRPRTRSLLVALGLLGLASWGCDSGTGPVDPERHRAALRKLEVILYRPTLPEPEDRKAIEDAASALAKEISGRPGTKAGEATRAIESFSEKIGGRGEERFTTVNLVEARSEWEELRGRHFVAAAWFGESTPFLERAQGGGSPRAPSAEASPPEQGVGFILEQMGGIVDRAETYFQGLGACGPDGHEKAAEEWDDWKRSLDNDVTRLKASLDPRYEREFQDAFRELFALSAPLAGSPCDLGLNGVTYPRVRRGRSAITRARNLVEQKKASG